MYFAGFAEIYFFTGFPPQPALEWGYRGRE
jgi:hypothetical protein